MFGLHLPMTYGNPLTFIQKCLRLDGNDSISIATGPGDDDEYLGVYIVSMWFRPSSLTGEQCLIRAWTNSDNWEILALDDDEIYFHCKESASNRWILTSTNANISNYTWHHLLMSLDVTESVEADRTYAYLNGTRLTWDVDNSVDLNSGRAQLCGSKSHILGRDTNRGTWFDGRLAQVFLCADVSIQNGDASLDDFGYSYGGVWYPRALDSGNTPGTTNRCLLDFDGDFTDSINSNDWSTEAGNPSINYSYRVPS